MVPAPDTAKPESKPSKPNKPNKPSKPKKGRLWDGSQFVLTLACVVIVIAGAKAAASILIPMLVAALLTILCIPPIMKLRAWHVPRSLAAVLVAAVAVSAIFFVVGVVSDSVQQFREAQSEYEDKFKNLKTGFNDWIQEHFPKQFGDFDLDEVMPDIEPVQVFEFITNIVGSVLGLVGDVFIIALLLFFALFEVDGLTMKVRRAMGDPDADLHEFGIIASKVYGYMSIKAVVSLMTGVLVGAMSWALGIDYPLLWGLVGFLFNFVPNIGSIIAAVPACLLALIQHGFGHMLLLGLGYVAINVVVGNIIEPKWMGRRLGLSTLVIMLSLLLWWWVLGPIGMLLSVPLTMIVKIVMEQTDDFRAIAILLGPSDGRDEPPVPRR